MSADAEPVFVRPDPTPGPWKACGTIYEHMNAEIRSGAKGEGVAIAQVWDADNAFSNALLIAAAPELLEACRALVASMRRYEVEVDGDAPTAHTDMMAQAEEAIVKATGESQ